MKLRVTYRPLGVLAAVVQQQLTSPEDLLEWQLPDGRTLVLEVDGGFHMEAEHWEDDLARQRALAATDRIIVRCTPRELRDEPERVARDLLALGVPVAA